MKLAAPFSSKEERQKQIDEYNISFDCSKHYIKNLIEWLGKQEKRINLKIIFNENAINKISPFDVLKQIKDFDNVYFRLGINQSDWLNFIQENEIKFFFDYDYNINSFCKLKDALKQGTTDVYIMEDLCYRLPQVRKLCDLHGARIRLVANMISSFTLGRGKDFTAPWYVPENFEKLNKYYNVIEFELFNSWQRFDVLYKIWFINHQWRDNLKFINFELERNIPGESFPNELCEYKMTCGHRCVERQTKCRKCKQYIRLAQMMKDKNIEYNSEKIWVEKDKEEPIEDILNK